MIALLYALVPSVSSAYWILSVMTTQVYLVVYLLMFVAARNLRQRQPNVERGYTAPWLSFLCVVGFLASAAAILIGFVPPSQFENGSDAAYVGLILAGTVLLGLLPPWLFLRLRKPSWKEGDGAKTVPAPAAPPAEPQAPAEPVAAAPPPTEPPMQDEPTTEGEHHRLRWIIGALVLVLLVIGLITYSGNKKDQEAQQKAQQLTQSLQQAGRPVPESQNVFIRSFGADGGNVCDNPASALGKAVLYDQLYNGADFVGRRPVIVDRRILRAEGLILQVYCPEKVKAYQDKVNKLKTDNVLKP